MHVLLGCTAWGGFHKPDVSLAVQNAALPDLHTKLQIAMVLYLILRESFISLTQYQSR